MNKEDEALKEMINNSKVINACFKCEKKKKGKKM